MSRFSAYIGLDVHKNSISPASAAADPGEPARSLGRLPHDIPRLLRFLSSFGAPGEVRICYEAGPTGYGLVRRLRAEGYTCDVVAPAKTPRTPSDRVKTDRRDAVKLATFLRNGLLTAIRVPTEEEEALRDLLRAREDIKRMEVNLRRQLGALFLRQGRQWTGTKYNWTKRHFDWAEKQVFEHRGTQEAKQQYLGLINHMRELLDEFDRSIEEVVPTLEQADLVRALTSLKGVKTLTAATIVAEVGDLRRFPSAGKFMSFLGLTPSESSSGDSRRRGPITKAGNKRLRRLLVEAAWTYRRSPHVSRELDARSKASSPEVKELAWKAQKRLHKRRWALVNAGKGENKTVVALARELAGFIWAIGREERLVKAS
jgi:transposase